MNQNCPSCGALYNVAEKDIGRKLKCKKCSAALVVTDAGLAADGGAPADDPKPKRERAAMADDYDDEPPVKKNRAGRFAGGGGLSAIGGVPTILFGIGVFFVILFTSMPIIGNAGTDRAKAGVDKLKHEAAVKKQALMPKGKKLTDLSESERKDLSEKSDKIDEDYNKRIIDAEIDATGTAIDNRRAVWMEQYGLMFGFMFLAFGSLGYLRTEQSLVLKIVAAVVLSIMLIVMFAKFGGCNMR